MKNTLRIFMVSIALFTSFFALSLITYAAPAAPMPFEEELTDGSKATLYLRGDEFFSYNETEDGQVVVRDGDGVYYTVVVIDGKPIISLPLSNNFFTERSAPSFLTRNFLTGSYFSNEQLRNDFELLKYRVSLFEKENFLPSSKAIEDGSFSSQKETGDEDTQQAEDKTLTMDDLPEIENFDFLFENSVDYSRMGSPTVSSAPLLVLMTEFADQKFSTSLGTNTEEYWSNVIFGPANSVKDYYLQNSNGKFAFSPAVENYGTANNGVVKVTLGINHPNFGGNTLNSNSLYPVTFGGTEITNSYNLATVAINAATSAGVNLASYDKNGNGIIETPAELTITMIVAGYEAAYGLAPSPNIWAHAWDWDDIIVSGSNKRISTYNMFGEIQSDHPATIGIICHELGHSIGLPDLYDTIGMASDNLGIISLMAYGNWGFNSGYQGSSPTMLDAWCKLDLGFYTPTVLSTGNVNLAPASSSADYSIIKIPTTDPKEYFLLENRQKIGYDSGLGADQQNGIAVWHIDEKLIDVRRGDNKINSSSGKLGVAIEYFSKTSSSSYTYLRAERQNIDSSRSTLNNGTPTNHEIKIGATNSTTKAVSVDVNPQLNTLTGTSTISNTTPKIGDILTGSLVSGNNTGTLTYTWKANGTQVGTNLATYTVQVGDLGKTITLEITSSVQTGTVTSTSTTAIVKKEAPTAPIAPTLVSKTHNSVTLTANALYEFSKDSTTWQTSNVFEGLTASTAYTFYQRVATTADTLESAASPGFSVTTNAIYTITYNANGGSGAPAAQIKIHNIDLILSTVVPTRSGYIFLGWSISSTATTATYTAGGSYTSNTAATLYAVWSTISVFPESAHPYANNFDYTWTHTVSGAGAVNITFSADTKVENNYDKIYIMDSNDNNISGSPFTGTQLAGATKTVNSGTVKIRLQTDHSVTDYGFKVTNIVASVATYTVTVNTNNTSYGTATANPSSATSGTTVTLTATPSSGYRFVNWTGTGVTFANSTSANTTFIMPSNNVTITANFELIPVITFPESAHPYANNFDYTWDYTVSGAGAVNITFSADTKVENGYDKIYVMDGSGNNISGSPFTGTQLAGMTKTVNSGTVKIRLTTDSSVTDYGFKVTNIVANTPITFPESSHPYANNFDYTWTHTVSGAGAVNITFSADTKVENNYDKIYIMDGSGNNIAGSPFTGTQLAGATKTVNSGTVKIRLTTDSSVTDYGFKVTNIVASVATYAVTVNTNNTSYGTATANPSSAVSGTTVTLTATPSSGYRFVNWTGTGVTFASATSTSTTFTMPSSNVTITANFELIPVITFPESAHPYTNNFDYTWTHTVPGAGAVNITFSADTNVENNYDKIYIMDNNGNNISGSPFTGAQLAGAIKTVNSGTVKIRLTTDSSVTDYGFKVINIVANTPITFPESAHPYTNNFDYTWTHTVPGAGAVNITFSADTRLENNYDKIYIMDSSGNNISGSPFTGTQLAGTTKTVNSGTVKIRLQTDSSVTDYGFKVTNIVASAPII